MEKTSLIIFAKRPALGLGKQRLAAETNKDVAFQVAEILLANTLERIKNVECDIIISPSTQDEITWAHGLLDKATICIPQREGNLGQRLMQVDKEARMLGYGRTIFIGTDAPFLSLNDIHSVKTALDNYSQVFIPATDGGVILMATKKTWLHLDKIEWSTEKVFSQLKSIAIQRGLSLRSFKAQTDLDDLAAYKQLRKKLDNHPLNELLDPFLK